MSEQLIEYRQSQFRRMLIHDPETLQTVVAEMLDRDAVGVDLEMAQRLDRKPGGYQEWTHILALIQIASDTLSVLVDPLRCTDLSPLRPLMAGPVRKVFLGGGQDVALLEKSRIPASNVVDVGEVALAVFGRREDGMAALAHRIFGISLDKTVRRADWMARPLNPVLVSYAHQDAEITLLIYRWFQRAYPEVLALHERVQLDPSLPEGAPDWLQEMMSRSSPDALAVLMDYGFDAGRDQDLLSDELRSVLRQATAPRQINRLLRAAGDIGLRGLLPDVLPLVHSQSSLIRYAAARAIGQLADPETGIPVLEPLAQDPIEDVRKAAELGLRDLRAPKTPAVAEEEPPVPSLDDNTLSALQALMRNLEERSSGT